MTKASIAIAVIGALTLLVAFVCLCIYGAQADNADRAQRLTRESTIDWFISSGALFIVGLFIFASYTILKRGALQVCLLGTKGASAKITGAAQGLWTGFGIAAGVALVLYAVAVALLQQEVANGSRWSHSNFVVAVISGTLFSIAAVFLLTLYGGVLTSDLKECFDDIHKSPDCARHWQEAIESMY